mmetsp:Transcript_58926/g.188248  ORF Transcript_58926/g.188248 Transcript_58926/m.188248 type:complete len:230 (+) Transcript_58926:727-1416(+)
MPPPPPDLTCSFSSAILRCAVSRSACRSPSSVSSFLTIACALRARSSCSAAASSATRRAPAACRASLRSASSSFVARSASALRAASEEADPSCLVRSSQRFCSAWIAEMTAVMAAPVAAERAARAASTWESPPSAVASCFTAPLPRSFSRNGSAALLRSGLTSSPQSAALIPTLEAMKRTSSLSCFHTRFTARRVSSYPSCSFFASSSFFSRSPTSRRVCASCADSFLF